MSSYITDEQWEKIREVSLGMAVSTNLPLIWVESDLISGLQMGKEYQELIRKNISETLDRMGIVIDV